MIEDIGRKIHDLRTAADLTQGELAERAGLTDGFISQVERGLTSISIDSLKQILDALNVPLSKFFLDEGNRRIKFSAVDQVEIEEGGNGRLWLLVPGATNRLMEPARLELKSGGSTSLRRPFQGDTFGYVLKGRLLLKFGAESLKLKAGESFYFTADAEHCLINRGRGLAVVLWLTSPPYF